MTRVLLLIDVMLLAALVAVLTSCTTLPAVNCANAAKVRAAATLALQALDRVCPMR
jgi:hypothetical protein